VIKSFEDCPAQMKFEKLAVADYFDRTLFLNTENLRLLSQPHLLQRSNKD
jgi:hypothetical protein